MQDRLINAILQREYSTCKEILEKVTAFDLDKIKVPELAILADYDFNFKTMPFIHWATVAATPPIFRLIMQVPRIDLNRLYQANFDKHDTPLTFLLPLLSLQYSFEIASLLVEDPRTNVNHDEGFFSPIQFLCRFPPNGSEFRRKSTRLLGVLLQRPDVNINYRAEQEPALILAVKYNFIVAVRLLLQHPNTDVDVKDADEDFNALFYARQLQHSEIVQMLLQHKYGFIDMTPLENEVLPPTFDIATDLPLAEPEGFYKYPRVVVNNPSSKATIRETSFYDLSPIMQDKDTFILNKLDYNNSMIGQFTFSKAAVGDIQKLLKTDRKYSKAIKHAFKTAYQIYTGFDETHMKAWPIAQKVVARKTFIGSMIQSFYDNLKYPKFVSDLKNRKNMIRSWLGLINYTFSMDKNKETLFAATLRHIDNYPLLYMIYSYVDLNGILLHSWVRSVEGMARSNSQNVALGAMALSLFISIIECALKRSISYIFMLSLEGTDRTIEKISKQLKEPLILLDIRKTPKAVEPDCLIVTDELRNYYKRYLNVEEPSQKKPKVAIKHCIACHVRANELFKPQGIEGQVFCGQDCYEHYHGVHEHYLH